MVEVDGTLVSCKGQHDPDKVMVILPTTMYFTQYQHITLDKIIKVICYMLFTLKSFIDVKIAIMTYFVNMMYTANWKKP